ncbi:MAG: hypothetical protein N3B16_07265 [Candidatus Aminicenantes bacterium]|nr:hypothetical protein [Candidatus Aminicenantes bacterium]
MTKPPIKKIIYSLISLILFSYLVYLFNVASLLPPVKTNPNPGEKEIVGVFHLHTRYSDGRGQIGDLVKAARYHQLDFIILTDHGRPNYACLQSQGWREGILVLAGSELSTSRGHLVALAIPDSISPIPRIAEEAARFIQKEGGFTIIAHPYSKTSWTWGMENEIYTGLELIDADTMLKKRWPSLWPYLPFLLFNQRAFALKMLTPFPSPFRQWDFLNQTNPPIYGFFSCDAHLMYKTLLNLFCLRLPLEKKLPSEFHASRNLVFEALRKGNFYNSIDAVQPAIGFKFWAEKGKQIYPMGSIIEIFPNETIRLKIRRPESVAAEIYLLYNGKKILASFDQEINYQPIQPGVYRVEVYLRERSILPKNIPWIVSNPLFIRMAKNDSHTLQPTTSF